MTRLLRLGLSLSLLMLVACASEPTPGSMVGRWGSPMLGLVAQPTTVDLHLACGALARFRGALHPDDAGRFQLAGLATHLWGSFRVELVGQVNGDKLNVTLTQIYDGGGQETRQEELLPGVTPDFPGIVCLA
jgi:hypothetical protein